MDSSELQGPQAIDAPTTSSPKLKVSIDPDEVQDLGDIDLSSYLLTLKDEGKLLRADLHQPSLSIKPPWLDIVLFENAKSVFERHFMAINFAHLSGLLILVRVESIHKTLKATGESETVAKMFRRYFHTLNHVKTWYEQDIFDQNTKGYRSLMITRCMHNNVSRKMNCDRNYVKTKKHCEVSPAETSEYILAGCGAGQRYSSEAVHLSMYDVMITQFAFIGFIVSKGNRMGLIEDFSQKDLESLIHFWRVIGYYLGARGKYNLCNYELYDIKRLCDTLMNLEYKESMARNPIEEELGIMSVNIIRSVQFIPMLTIYGILNYLYELMGFDNSELKTKKTYYSKLSYTLIKLVMSRLLAYQPLRSFNNGLLRLSIFCVGKIENNFAGFLESKYGQKLEL